MSLLSSDVENPSPSHHGLAFTRPESPDISNWYSEFRNSDVGEDMSDGASSDEDGSVSGGRTSSQGSYPLCGPYGNEHLYGDPSSDENSDYYPPWGSDDDDSGQPSVLSADQERAISELSKTVLACAHDGIQTDVIEQCVTVMSNVRGIPSEGGPCMCVHCYREFPWRDGPVARMNRSCGAFAWGPSRGLVVGPNETSPLIEHTWENVSIVVDEWGRTAGRKLELEHYRTVNCLEDGKSFSPAMAAGPQHTGGFNVLAIGVEGMLNGAGMYEHYPAIFASVEEHPIYDFRHTWIDCAKDPPEIVIRPAREPYSCLSRDVPQPARVPYACVSHTWGRYCCKGTKICQGTGVYRLKHVCRWGKDLKDVVYWDERKIIAAVAAKWKGDLWLDWADIPQDPPNPQDPLNDYKQSDKTRKLNSQAALFAEADRVFVFVPETDFNSISKAIHLSKTATTRGDFIEVIHLLHSVAWFTSTWTLQEMFMSYECMEVVAYDGNTIPCGEKTIPCGWLERLKDRLADLMESHGALLYVDDVNKLIRLGILHLGGEAGQFVAAALM
ncbi:hypothetical protein BGZ74_003736, partial [Mortierella antarctica]